MSTNWNWIQTEWSRFYSHIFTRSPQTHPHLQLWCHRPCLRLFILWTFFIWHLRGGPDWPDRCYARAMHYRRWHRPRFRPVCSQRCWALQPLVEVLWFSQLSMCKPGSQCKRMRKKWTRLSLWAICTFPLSIPFSFSSFPVFVSPFSPLPFLCLVFALLALVLQLVVESPIASGLLFQCSPWLLSLCHVCSVIYSYRLFLLCN